MIQCVIDSGATEVEIIRPPGRQRSWLLKALVAEENDLGVVAIEAKDRTLLLNRVMGRPKRNVEVVQVIHAAKHRVPECHVRTPTAAATSATATGNASAEVREQRRQEGSRERSRSPAAKDEEPKFPYSNKYEELECGGGGDCGYLCIAAGMAFDRGETWESMKDQLLARSRTIRNDLFKHMSSSKHEEEYKSWFVPGMIGNGEQEGGEPPKDWQSWLQSTLRPGRWIDGISIRAACKRYGLHIIVIPRMDHPKNRPMVFGTPRSGRPPIVLLLHKGHYRLARLKVGLQWPQEFLNAEVASISDGIFRAGGKSWKAESTCGSQGSWRPVRTPAPAEHSHKCLSHCSR